jgi:hypothetical protein
MNLEETPGTWLAANRVLLSVLGIALVLLAVTLLGNKGKRPDITNPLSRANCQHLYSQARSRAESLAIDGEAASAYRERKIGYLQPDVRCGEIRKYDSARGQ